METLKQRLARKPAVLAAGGYDALSALLIEQAGFEAIYVSGAGIAYTQLGRPDLGLVSFDHVVDVVSRMRERVALPLIVDADTGFGNALNVQRTVRLLERAGATAIQLEDQTFPKRCGHLSNKSIVSTSEMLGKLSAALDARRSSETLVIARTDAVAIDGLDAALERAQRYVECGVDVLFVEAPRSLAELVKIVETIGGRVPLLANMVEGGVTPILTCAELSEIGFDLVISPAALIRAQVRMTEHFLESLREHGSTLPYADRMLDLKALNVRVELEQLASTGARYDASYQVVPAVEVL